MYPQEEQPHHLQVVWPMEQAMGLMEAKHLSLALWYSFLALRQP
jgi:hypothetical protein